MSSGFETRVSEVVKVLSKLTVFSGKIIWDTDRPDGQLRRCFDTSKAKKELSFIAETSLEKGLQLTVDWYRRNRINARSYKQQMK